jgi:hypothetical protein
LDIPQEDLLIVCAPSHRAAAGKDVGKGHKKRGPRRIYSTLTAQEHAWYLAKQGLLLCWHPQICA